MSVIETEEPPALAAPRRPEGRETFWQFLRVVRDNLLAIYPPEACTEDIIARRLLWHRTFIINEPGAIRRVFLDNAQNYTVSELSRRVLEPGLGRGLLTSEGETWRHHRRIMAPAFDPRSVVGYAPVMSEVIHELLAKVITVGVATPAWDSIVQKIDDADEHAAPSHCPAST
ncbi:MAG: cytochrome P450 [Methylocella sp.]